VRIDINELEVLAPDYPAAGPAADPGGADANAARPAADLGAQWRHWQRDARARERRLLAD
jgi:hypothetical protein